MKNMSQFDINKVINEYNLDTTKLASVLFPTAKYPASALERVIKGLSTLNVNQFIRLADYINVDVHDLVNTNSKWSARAHKGVLTFTRGEYRADMCCDSSTAVTRLYKGDDCIETFVINFCMATLSSVVEQLSASIKKYESHSKQQ